MMCDTQLMLSARKDIANSRANFVGMSRNGVNFYGEHGFVSDSI